MTSAWCMCECVCVCVCVYVCVLQWAEPIHLVYMSDFDASLRPTHRMYVHRGAQFQQHVGRSPDLCPLVHR
jgi:hypothetical protein